MQQLYVEQEGEGSSCSMYCTSEVITSPELLEKHKLRSASYKTSIINHKK
jgi:hypothetical protein